jgi:hypothetical protein
LEQNQCPQSTLELTKPDGRAMTLYGCGGPVRVDGPAPSPFPDPLHVNLHLCWHLLRDVGIAGRQRALPLESEAA